MKTRLLLLGLICVLSITGFSQNYRVKNNKSHSFINSNKETDVFTRDFCQEFSIVLVNISPDTTMVGNIDGCYGITVCLEVAGNYENNDQNYHQVDSTTQFTWYFDDGDTAIGQSVCHIYSYAGVYEIICIAKDTANCINVNNFKQMVRVSPPVEFLSLPNNNMEYCINDTLNLIASLFAEPFLDLPLKLTYPYAQYIDQSSALHYIKAIECNQFHSDSIVNEYNEILEICVNMEHSYLGDLHMKLICPNGQSIILKRYPGGGGTFLGHPVDNSIPSFVGVGFEYCWTNNPTYGTMLSEVGNHVTSFVCNYGTTYTNVSWLPPGSYEPEQSFSNLYGCPLNGNWILDIQDTLAIDDGNIFNWSIAFDTPTLSFETYIDSVFWIGGNILEQHDTTALVVADTIGWQTYTLTAYNNFGCQFDTIVNIFVHPLSPPEITALEMDSIGTSISWINTTEYCELSKNNIFLGNNVYLDNIPTPIATNVTNNQFVFTNLSNGLHQASVSAVYNNGESTKDSIEFTWLSSNLNSIKNIEVYPIPAKGNLFIDNVANSDIYIYNAMGVIIESKENITGSTSFNLSNATKGIYMVKIVSKNNAISKKINIVD